MQQFILIRGHQGSGKSTFAKQKIDEFLKTYPNALIIHLENDLLLTDEKGVYRWSVQAVDKAQRQNLATFKNALKQGRQNPSQHILIVNSNTNQKVAACTHLMQMAKKFDFEVQVYRLHNFFNNTHNVKQADVLTAYINLNNNRLKEEIHVPAIKPIDAATQALVDKMNTFSQGKLPFDEVQNTFVTDEYLTFARKNFSKKTSKRYPELSVLKYARKVFYENSFDDALLEMRGLIVDSHNRIIVRPFKKVFNYSERITQNSRYPITISDDTIVNAVVKVNGFLGVCTFVDLDNTHPSFGASFNRQVLYSTTGSLDSDFAKMTQSHCQQYESVFKAFPNHTFLFEITDPADVHIINEDFGETLIGVVDVATGVQFDEKTLDEIGKKFGLKRPQAIEKIPFGELKALLKMVKHEGFMVFDEHWRLLFKLKSPYYLISKFLGRSTDKNLSHKLNTTQLNKQEFDEEYYPLVDYIKANKQMFNQMNELDKIAFIQGFLEKLD
ncbi:2'-5' RNA ligase [Moraxella nasovis]|uniref:RNA ligase n=1 Tax=Moraxella nasovis TaxID=2904121 RepID=UPI001F600DDF|nr:RNA ligase [Moraxella nasovis]UNU73778.1 2'-5' RNA ligase [Moraxella nasovis]